MKRLLVATHNEAKVRELTELLAPARIEVLGIDHLDDRTPVHETGTTFEENARLKAEAYSRRTPLPVLADDSGLEVDALEGEPGVQSARYGGEGLTDADRCDLVLARLAELPPETPRTARFRCVLTLAAGGRTVATFDGTVEGRIATKPAGTGGFGYDPIFFHPESGRTFGQLSAEEKHRVSHRGRALAALLAAVQAGHVHLPGAG